MTQIDLRHGDCLDVLRSLLDASVDAVVLEGFRFIGIEREAEYVEIARARIEAVTPATDEPAEAEPTEADVDQLTFAF